MELNLKPKINYVYLVFFGNEKPMAFESEENAKTYLNTFSEPLGARMNHPSMYMATYPSLDVVPPTKDIAILKYDLVEDSRFKDLNIHLCNGTTAKYKRDIDNVFFVVTEVNGGVAYLAAFESDVDADNWINIEHKDRASEFQIVSLKIKKVHEGTN